MCVRCVGADALSAIRNVIMHPQPRAGRTGARGRLRRPGLAGAQAQGLCQPRTLLLIAKWRGEARLAAVCCVHPLL
jgi:hypothetical protein